MGKQRIVVYGAGGLAREIAWLVDCANATAAQWEIACFIDDQAPEQGQEQHGVPVTNLGAAVKRFPEALAVVGVGAPRDRERLSGALAARGFGFISLIHPNVVCSRWSLIGGGCLVQAGCIVSVDVRLGEHVLLNGASTVGHDSVIGDFSVVGPGVNISGHVHIGRGVLIGTGATILEGTPSAPLLIGDGAVIAAGACVLRSVETGQTVAGVPARPLVRRCV